MNTQNQKPDRSTIALSRENYDRLSALKLEMESLVTPGVTYTFDGLVGELVKLFGNDLIAEIGKRHSAG